MILSGRILLHFKDSGERSWGVEKERGVNRRANSRIAKRQNDTMKDVGYRIVILPSITK